MDKQEQIKAAAHLLSVMHEAAIEMAEKGMGIRAITGIIGVMAGQLVDVESKASKESKEAAFQTVLSTIIEGIESSSGIKVAAFEMRRHKKNADDDSPAAVTAKLTATIGASLQGALSAGMPAGAAALTLAMLAGKVRKEEWEKSDAKPEHELPNAVQEMLSGFLMGAEIQGVEVGVASGTKDDAEQFIKDLAGTHQKEKTLH